MYQRDCVSNTKDVVLRVPELRYFERRMYRGMLFPLHTLQSPAVRTALTFVVSGLGVNMARSFVLNAVFFSAFEAIKKQINNLEV